MMYADLRLGETHRGFYGRTYSYRGTPAMREDADAAVALRIGVFRGLGDLYIVGYYSRNGSHRRIKAPALKVYTDPAVVQDSLDRWAVKKGLGTWGCA